MNIRYQGRKIELSFLGRDTFPVNYKMIVTGMSSGKQYSKVEQEAFLYLIKDAELKCCSKKLSRIISLKQDVSFDNNTGEVEMILSGIPIFEKRNRH